LLHPKLESDLASNQQIPQSGIDAINAKISSIDEEIELAKKEVYAEELKTIESGKLSDKIKEHEELLKDESLSEETREVIQKEIDADKEELKSVPISEPTAPIIEGSPEEISQPIELSTEVTDKQVYTPQLSDAELKEIAQQAQNVSATGEDVTIKGFENATRNTLVEKYGPETVNAAIAKYPKEKLLNEPTTNTVGETIPTNEGATTKQGEGGVSNVGGDVESKKVGNFTADISDAKNNIEDKVASIDANMKKYGVTNDASKSLMKRAIEKVDGISVNNVFDLAQKIAKNDNKPILIEHIAEAIQYEVGRTEAEKDAFNISLDDIKETILSQNKEYFPANKERMEEIGCYCFIISGRYCWGKPRNNRFSRCRCYSYITA